MEYILRNIDRSLWTKLKIMAAVEKTTMREIILTLIERAVNDFNRGK